MDDIEKLCEWLKITKGITKIDLEDLVSYIPEYEKYLASIETGWTANYIECDLCSHKWISVYTAQLDKLECPNCTNIVTFKII